MWGRGRKLDYILKGELLCGSIIFFIYIVLKIKNKELELKYVLTWLLGSIIFIILDLFPQALFYFSKIVHIVEPVNALFLILIVSLIIITFSLTVALSRNTNRVKSLVQEIGILRFELENRSADTIKK